MILSKINFTLKPNEPDSWEIKDVILGPFNLIVGLNATGKTRFLNIITNLAKILTKKSPPLPGCWIVEFKKEDEQTIYKYELEIKNNIIIKEVLWSGNDLLLERHKDSGKIYSFERKETVKFSPPQNELSLNVRRDVKEHLFLEDLYTWAGTLLRYDFSGVMSRDVAIPLNQTSLLDNLNTTPYLLREIIENKGMLDRIIKDFSSIGYPVEDIGVKIQKMQGISEVCIAAVKEKDLGCETLQPEMSQGMFRALSLLVIIEHILNSNKKCTVIIDDIGEGLDYTRSSKLTGLLLDKVKDSNLQLIITSNDRFLINSVDIKSINFLERQGHSVKAFNYFNSKDKYEEFIFSGLDNFDFLRGKMYN